MKLRNGEPWKVKGGEGSFHTCCDCGLAHFVLYDVIKDGFQMCYYRDEDLTDKNRKEEKIVVYRRK